MAASLNLIFFRFSAFASAKTNTLMKKKKKNRYINKVNFHKKDDKLVCLDQSFLRKHSNKISETTQSKLISTFT